VCCEGHHDIENAAVDALITRYVKLNILFHAATAGLVISPIAARAALPDPQFAPISRLLLPGSRGQSRRSLSAQDNGKKGILFFV
jgi:hypothetical protein